MLERSEIGNLDIRGFVGRSLIIAVFTTRAPQPHAAPAQRTRREEILPGVVGDIHETLRRPFALPHYFLERASRWFPELPSPSIRQNDLRHDLGESHRLHLVLLGDERAVRDHREAKALLRPREHVGGVGLQVERGHMRAIDLDELSDPFRRRVQPARGERFVEDLSPDSGREARQRRRRETGRVPIRVHPLANDCEPARHVIAFGDQRIVEIEDQSMDVPHFSEIGSRATAASLEAKLESVAHGIHGARSRRVKVRGKGNVSESEQAATLSRRRWKMGNARDAEKLTC